MFRDTGKPPTLTSPFARRLDGLTKGMISVEVPAVRLVPLHVSADSSMGNVDRLPPELLDLMLHTLDLRSLARLSQTCRKGQLVVLSMRAYHDLLLHAPAAMDAFGKTGCIKHYTLTEIYNVLCSEDCASCGFFGAFLFLPTCQRCFYECLDSNQARWVTNPHLARKCFNLKPQHMKKLINLRCPAGLYRFGPRHHQSMSLVSVQAAKAIALEVHGSTTEMPDWNAISRTASDKKLIENNYLRWLQEAPMEGVNCDPVKAPEGESVPRDGYSGMGSIPFPTLANGELDGGTLCLGCRWLSMEWPYIHRREIEIALSSFLSNQRSLEHVCLGLSHRAWTRTALLAHVETCYGVKHLPVGWRER